MTAAEKSVLGHQLDTYPSIVIPAGDENSSVPVSSLLPKIGTPIQIAARGHAGFPLASRPSLNFKF